VRKKKIIAINNFEKKKNEIAYVLLVWNMGLINWYKIDGPTQDNPYLLEKYMDDNNIDWKKAGYTRIDACYEKGLQENGLSWEDVGYVPANPSM
jgi:Ni,Fe-hydrogenase III large subunit